MSAGGYGRIFRVQAFVQQDETGLHPKLCSRMLLDRPMTMGAGPGWKSMG